MAAFLRPITDFSVSLFFLVWLIIVPLFAFWAFANVVGPRLSLSNATASVFADAQRTNATDVDLRTQAVLQLSVAPRAYLPPSVFAVPASANNLTMTSATAAVVDDYCRVFFAASVSTVEPFGHRVVLLDSVLLLAELWLWMLLLLCSAYYGFSMGHLMLSIRALFAKCKELENRPDLWQTATLVEAGDVLIFIWFCRMSNVFFLFRQAEEEEEEECCESTDIELPDPTKSALLSDAPDLEMEMGRHCSEASFSHDNVTTTSSSAPARRPRPAVPQDFMSRLGKALARLQQQHTSHPLLPSGSGFGSVGSPSPSPLLPGTRSATFSIISSVTAAPGRTDTIAGIAAANKSGPRGSSFTGAGNLPRARRTLPAPVSASTTSSALLVEPGTTPTLDTTPRMPHSLSSSQLAGGAAGGAGSSYAESGVSSVSSVSGRPLRHQFTFAPPSTELEQLVHRMHDTQLMSLRSVASAASQAEAEAEEEAAAAAAAAASEESEAMMVMRLPGAVAATATASASDSDSAAATSGVLRRVGFESAPLVKALTPISARVDTHVDTHVEADTEFVDDGASALGSSDLVNHMTVLVACLNAVVFSCVWCDWWLTGFVRPADAVSGLVAADASAARLSPLVCAHCCAAPRLRGRHGGAVSRLTRRLPLDLCRCVVEKYKCTHWHALTV